MLRYCDQSGRKFFSMIEYTLEAFLMVYLAFRASVFNQAQGFRTIFSVISAQVYFTGWQALSLVGVIALGTGAAVVVQANSQLAFIGGSKMLGDLLVAVVMRELGPLLTAMIVIARSGTAVASELGNMRVNREVEALEVMGIDPLSYIVFPRVMGGIISVLCLAFYFNLIAVLGGYLVCIMDRSMDFSYYLDLIIDSLRYEDIHVFFLKNTFSGAMIFIIACKQGLSVQRSSHEVPQMTTLAVVRSLVFVVGFNVLVSAWFYLNKLSHLGVL